MNNFLREPWVPLLGVCIFVALVFSAVVVINTFRIEREIKSSSNVLDGYGYDVQDKSAFFTQINRLNALVIEEKEKFFVSGEVEPSNFGLAVKNLLTQEGLIAESYRIHEEDGLPHYDFSVTGRLTGFINFIKHMSQNKKYCIIKYVSLNTQKGDGAIRASMQITYETLEAADNQVKNLLPIDDIIVPYSDLVDEKLTDMIKLFMWAGKVEEPKGEEDDSTPPTPRNTEEPQVANWLKFVGSVEQDGEEFLIFIDADTNRIYRLTRDEINADGWLYLEASGDNHYLKKGDTTYIVKE